MSDQRSNALADNYDFPAMAHLTDAKGYLAAATLLVPHEGNLAIFSPILLLLSHAIELALKAFILAARGTQQELRHIDVRHN